MKQPAWARRREAELDLRQRQRYAPPPLLCEPCKSGDHSHNNHWQDCECDFQPKEEPVNALPTEIRKPLEESLTPDDLRTAMDLAQLIPDLQKAWGGTDYISSMQAGIAAEAMRDATRIRTLLWDRDTVDVKRAYDLHRSLTAKRDAKVKFFDQVVALTKSIIGRRTTEQQRIANEKRREAERLAREEAERQRQAEVDARLTEAAAAEKAGNTDLAELILEEAHDAEQAPVIPVSVPEVAPTKIEGISTSFKLVGTVRHSAKYVCELLGIEYTPAIETRANLLTEVIGSWSQSGINAQLKRGLKFSEDALGVEKVPTVRNLSAR